MKPNKTNHPISKSFAVQLFKKIFGNCNYFPEKPGQSVHISNGVNLCKIRVGNGAVPYRYALCGREKVVQRIIME